MQVSKTQIPFHTPSPTHLSQHCLIHRFWSSSLLMIPTLVNRMTSVKFHNTAVFLKTGEDSHSPIFIELQLHAYYIIHYSQAVAHMFENFCDPGLTVNVQTLVTLYQSEVWDKKKSFSLILAKLENWHQPTLLHSWWEQQSGGYCQTFLLGQVCTMFV